jgi:ABC-2 type transport system permease protein
MRQEWQRYFNNFTYFMNTSVGMIILMVMSVYVIFIDNPIKDMIIQLMAEQGDVVARIWQTFVLVIASVGSMTCTTGVSISLEGKSLWILKSIPADVKEIFLAKILINLALIMVPSTLSLLGLGIAFHLPLLYYLTGILMLAASALFISMLGLLINLRFPKLEFDREVVVIKQSLSAFLSIMIPMFLAIGIMVLFFMTGMNTFYWIMAFFVAADLILAFLLLKYGTERFRKLA